MAVDRSILHFSARNHIYYGADQNWYPNPWQIQSGCGPTCASHLVWYLARTGKQAGRLCSYTGNSKENILRLMIDIWDYVTPGMLGVHTTGMFCEGIIKYGQEKGVPLEVYQLDCNPLPAKRPSYEEVSTFIERAFEHHAPVAFLNRSNGDLANLSSWHWVTLMAQEENGMLIYDQGRSKVIDLKTWLNTNILGGGFVWIDEKSN